MPDDLSDAQLAALDHDSSEESGMAGIPNYNHVRRAVAELRRLRSTVASLTSERDDRAESSSHWMAEEYRRTKERDAAIRERDEARLGLDRVAGRIGCEPTAEVMLGHIERVVADGRRKDRVIGFLNDLVNEALTKTQTGTLAEIADLLVGGLPTSYNGRLLTAPTASPAPLTVAAWRPEVVAFADAMEAKLRENDCKGGWECMTTGALMTRLYQEARELSRALRRGASPEAVLGEAADVANFAMMVADRRNALPIDAPDGGR